ncbi:MAG TPA: N-acetylmuramoyl-L-alanine amidase [Bacteroidales bacterium]|nr:N-acetylmuramoyl-L-alanine amidase [Bacteroidales bacterium]
MKKLLILLLLSINTLSYTIAQETSSSRFSKIVIDPGHGGDKPGAKGKRSLEKHINLAVSLKLGELINNYLPDVKVIYTRTKDVDVDLINRSRLANREKADLFISIHCNAAPNRTACGTETFVMGLAKSQANIEAAKKENADILTEANYAENYDGFDPNSPESNIFFALYQNAYLEQSLSLADKIQKHYTANTKLYDRGVKQAPYLVLYKTSVPAVLTEIGFISNEREEKYLNTEKGQYEIAASIFQAIFNYKNRIEGKKIAPPSISELIPHRVIKEEEERIKREEEERKIREEQDRIALEKQKEIDAQQKEKEAREKEANEKDSIATEEETNDVVYRVQVFVDKAKLSKEDSRLKDLEEVWMYKDNKMWKYTAGNFNNFNQANEYRRTLKDKGYKDAFVVIFHKNKRISLERAKELEKENNK